MSDDLEKTSVEETGSVEEEENEKSFVDDLNEDAGEDVIEEDDSGEEEENTESVDFRQLFQQQFELSQKLLKEKENLEKLLGRQGNELGELRKRAGAGEFVDGDDALDKIDPNEYFDDETRLAIKKIIDNEIKQTLQKKEMQQTQEQLQQEFQQVMRNYDIPDERTVVGIGSYMDATGCTLREAVSYFEQIGVLKRKQNKSGKRSMKDPGQYPRGKPRVSSSKGAGRSYLDYTVDEWEKISPEERERILESVCK